MTNAITDILLGHIRAGMKPRAIATLYGVTDQAVRDLVKSRGWNRPAPAMTEPAADAPATLLVDTPQKTITCRLVLAAGRDFRMEWIRISLPRVPTLHGQFQGA